MSKKLYQESLQKLQAELKNTTVVQKNSQEIISTLSGNVLAILDHPGEVPFIHHYNLLSTLKDSVAHFEADHPSLTSSIRNVIHTLSNMGI